MKKIITLLVVLGALLALAPFGFGFWAQARMDSMLADLNAAGMVEFTTIKMDRGWFSSEAIIEAELGTAYSPKLGQLKKAGGVADIPTVILKNTVHHGPFPFMSGQISLMPTVATIDTKFVKSLQGDEPMVDFDYSMLTDMSLSGYNQVKMDIPEWDGPVDNGKLTLQWEGLKGDIGFSSGLKDGRINIAAPSLKLEGKGGNMLMQSLKIDSESEEGIEGLSLGSATFSIGKIAVRDTKKGVDFSIDKLGITADSTASGDNIDSTAAFNIESFSLAGDRFGPGVFNMAFRKLDAGALGRINKKYRELNKQRDLPAEQVSMSLGMTLLSELSTLLKKGPEIEISELSLGSSNGKLIGTAMVTVDTSRPEMLSNPMLIKDAVIGEVDVEIPEELLVALNMAALRQEFKGVNIEYTEEQLTTMAKNRVNKRFAPLVGANIFTQVGNMYKFKASFKDGVPVVNGKPFQIPMGGAAQPPGR